MKKLFTFLLIGVLFSTFFSAKGQGTQTTRATMLINHVADYYPTFSSGLRPSGYKGCGSLSDFGKFNYPKIIALMQKYGVNQDTANNRLGRYKDCPTFHFNLVGYPRVRYLFPGSPAIQAYDTNYIRKVWERTDSYNAWTAEGTENHINMTKPSAYLYAQMALDYPANFPDAQQRLDSVKHWIMYYTKRVLQTGTGEFNSTIYGAYNIIGWLNLFDFATDADVKAAARAILDYYSFEMALHYTQGQIGGYDMRGNRQIASFDGSAAWIGWVWFGQSPRPTQVATLNMGDNNATEMIQAIHAATSTYAPPPHFKKLAEKDLLVGKMINGSKPGYLLENDSYIKHTFYVGKHYTLGAAYFPYGGWTSADWQIVSWKLLANADSGTNKSVQFVSGTGTESAFAKWFKYGNYRTPYDQLVHHKNVMVHLTSVPSNAASQKSAIGNIINQWKNQWLSDFNQRFPTETYKNNNNPVNAQNPNVGTNQCGIVVSNLGTVTPTLQNNILYVELENVFLAIRSIYNTAPTNLSPCQDGQLQYTKDNAPLDSLCGLIMEVGSKADYIALADFQTAIETNTNLYTGHRGDLKIKYTNLDGDVIDIQYNRNGTFTEPIYDWGYGPTTPQNIQTSPPYLQPDWLAQLDTNGHGKVATWRVNGQLVDLNKPWPVYQLKQNDALAYPQFEFKIDSNQLSLTYKPNSTTTEYHQIDYTGYAPVFNSGTITGLQSQPQNLQKANQKTTIELAPNPAGTQVRLTVNQTGIVQLINLKGQVVTTTNVVANSTKTIYTGALPRGAYFVRHTNPRGIVSVTKLMLQ